MPLKLPTVSPGADAHAATPATMVPGRRVVPGKATKFEAATAGSA